MNTSSLPSLPSFSTTSMKQSAKSVAKVNRLWLFIPLSILAVGVLVASGFLAYHLYNLHQQAPASVASVEKAHSQKEEEERQETEPDRSYLVPIFVVVFLVVGLAVGGAFWWRSKQIRSKHINTYAKLEAECGPDAEEIFFKDDHTFTDSDFDD